MLHQYLYFQKQSEKLLVLQEDYRTYMLAVNKILQDYNRTKEQLDLLKSAEVVGTKAIKKKTGGANHQKKKEVGDVGLGFYTFDFMEGARVYSSDDAPENDEENFLPVNRDPEHLKKSAIDYFRRLEDQSLLSRVDGNDWGDYTDKTLFSKQQAEKQKKKEASRRRRGKKIVAYRTEKSGGGQEDVSPEKKQARGIDLSWPIREQWWPSSHFGPRKKPNGTWGFHYGLDMAAVRGTPVYAAQAGLVTEARFDRAYGNTIVITHDRQFQTRYAHLHKILVKTGQKVSAHDIVGKVGSTGAVWKRRGRDASHLHFEVHSFGKQVNPLRFLS